MCSSSVTELSLSHAGLRQDYKGGSELPCARNLLICLAWKVCPVKCDWQCALWWPLTFWEAFPWFLELLSVDVLTITCWFLHGAWPPTSTSHLFLTCLVTSSEAAKQALSLWWHVHYIGHMADWLYAGGDNWSQAAPALLLQQMGEAWHSIFRQMPPPYSTCLEVGHCTEWTVCLMMRETKGTFMKLSRAEYLLSMHNIIVDHNNKRKLLLVRRLVDACNYSRSWESLLFISCFGVFNFDD